MSDQHCDAAGNLCACAISEGAECDTPCPGCGIFMREEKDENGENHFYCDSCCIHYEEWEIFPKEQIFVLKVSGNGKIKPEEIKDSLLTAALGEGKLAIIEVEVKEAAKRNLEATFKVD